ncbi:hypothetical protein FQA47_002142 [Oryzias melastigma]|uniref:Uncharacterized protein n=1 Tax=Oryzias melastigma TaxID=30732 RepID=A0A834BXE0_ORYME|nr:hypothetical protein FQA47_002142 [Oryzias melastigma]
MRPRRLALQLGTPELPGARASRLSVERKRRSYQKSTTRSSDDLWRLRLQDHSEARAHALRSGCRTQDTVGLPGQGKLSSLDVAGIDPLIAPCVKPSDAGKCAFMETEQRNENKLKNCPRSAFALELEALRDNQLRMAQGVREDKARGSGLCGSDKAIIGCSPYLEAHYTSEISRCAPADKRLSE